MKKAATLSVTEAARLLKCTTKYVYDLLRSGALEASKADGQWRIQKAPIESRIAKRAGK